MRIAVLAVVDMRQRVERPVGSVLATLSGTGLHFAVGLDAMR